MDDARQPWSDNAEALADFVQRRMINRGDAYGLYEGHNGRTAKSQLTRQKIISHFRGDTTIGLHSTSTSGSSRWLVFDVDCHEGDGVSPVDTKCMALAIEKTLREVGLRSFVLSSDGNGSYHVLVIFGRPQPTDDVYEFARWVVGQHKDIPVKVETFPKQGAVPHGGYGNWLRLVGIHPKHGTSHQCLREPYLLSPADTVGVLLAHDVEGQDGNVIQCCKYRIKAGDNGRAPALPNGVRAPALPNGVKIPPAESTEAVLSEPVPAGKRNETCFKLCCDLVGRGYAEDEIFDQVKDRFLADGLPEVEILNCAKSAMSKPRTAVDDSKPVTETREPPPPWQAFPIELLPQPLRQFVTEGAESMQVDPVFFALPVLAVCGSAIGTTRRLKLKADWFEFPIIWSAVISRSGAKKTPPLDLAVSPIRNRQTAAFADHETAKSDHEVELAKHEIERREWQKAKDGSEPPTKPEPPICDRYYCSDVTIEAIAPILKGNPRGVLVHRDELAGWISGFDAYKHGSGVDVNHWLSMSRGVAMTVDRKGGDHKTIHVTFAAVGITGSIQPRVLRHVIGEEHKSNGLLARFLLALPPVRPVRWSEDSIDAVTMDNYTSVVDRLLSLVHDEVSDDLLPRDIELTPDAKNAFATFVNDFGDERADELDDTLDAAYSKLEAYAARLALIFHYVRWAHAGGGDETPVDLESMDAGIRVVRWFVNETRRVYQILGESSSQHVLRDLADFVTVHGGRMSIREIQRATKKFGKTADDVRDFCRKAADAGYGAIETETPTTGGTPSEFFGVVPTTDFADSTKNPTDGLETQKTSGCRLSVVVGGKS